MPGLFWTLEKDTLERLEWFGNPLVSFMLSPANRVEARP